MRVAILTAFVFILVNILIVAGIILSQYDWFLDAVALAMFLIGTGLFSLMITLVGIQIIDEKRGVK